MTSLALQIKIPDKLIEKWRYVETTHFNWYEYQVEDFETQLTEKHMGVSFTLSKLEFDTYHKTCYFPISVTDWRAFLTYHQLEDEYPTILRYHAYGQGCDLELSSRSLGKYSVDVEWESYLVSFSFNSGLDEFTVATLDAWLEEEVYKIIPFIKWLFADLYKELLAALISEEDWLTSDTHVEGTIRSNLDMEDIVERCLDCTGNVVWESIPEEAPCLN